MRRRHWRWLWLWVGVLVAGCGQILSSDSTPPATRQPTLLGYTPRPPSLTPDVRATHTPLVAGENPGALLMLALRITGAACYETPVGSLACLGQVRNTSDEPFSDVRVEVQLLSREGRLLAAQDVPVSRWMIPAGTAGPYRVLFERVPDGYASAYPFIKDGQVVPAREDRYALLTLQTISGQFVLDQYEITLSIANKHPAAVEQIALTMTLLDDYRQVTGFRRLYLAPGRQLQPGESLALTLKVIPQGPNTVNFEAFAEGYLVER